MFTRDHDARPLFRPIAICAATLFSLAPLALTTAAASAASPTVASVQQAATTTAVGTVRTDAGGPVTLRASASTAATSLGSIASGTTITITCQTTGTTVTGKYGTSNLWDKTTSGGKTGYVSDTYVYTGSDGRVAPDCDQPSVVQKVIDAAKSQVGKGYVYSWGAGGKAGPSYGICCSPSGSDDRQRYGYDCSGFTQYAFWKGAGIDIGGTSSVQVTKGRKVPWASRKPGDLIFWYSSSGATTHVAIYLGNDQIIESAPPRNSNSVHVTAVYGSHSQVVRIID